MPAKFSDLKRLFRRKTSSATVTVPAGRRIYAIGDVHGRADLLRQMHQMIAGDAAKRGWAKNQLIYLGDYIDRGPHSREVLALVREDNLPGFSKVALRGNHEAMLLGFLEDPGKGRAWLEWGGDAALQSFGVSRFTGFVPQAQITDAAAQLSSALGASELDFLQTLKSCHREGGYFFSHAGVRPGVALEAQKVDDLLWIRRPFLECEEDFGAIVVHGHSVNLEVEVRRNRIGIDTGAYLTGKLTCLILEGNQRWLLQTGQPVQTAVPLGG